MKIATGHSLTKLIALLLIMLFVYNISGSGCGFCIEGKLATGAGEELRPTAKMNSSQLVTSENRVLETTNIKNNIESLGLQSTTKPALALATTVYLRNEALTNRFSAIGQLIGQINRARLESMSPIEQKELYEMLERLGLSSGEFNDANNDPAENENSYQDKKKNSNVVIFDSNKGIDGLGVRMDTPLSGDEIYLGDGHWLIVVGEDNNSDANLPYALPDTFNISDHLRHIVDEMPYGIGMKSYYNLQNAFNDLKRARQQRTALYKPKLKDTPDSETDKPSQDKNKVNMFESGLDKKDNDTKNNKTPKQVKPAVIQKEPPEVKSDNVQKTSYVEPSKTRSINSEKKAKLFESFRQDKNTAPAQVKQQVEQAERLTRADSSIDMRDSATGNDWDKAKEGLNKLFEEVVIEDPGAIYVTEGNEGIGAVILLPAAANTPQQV